MSSESYMTEQTHGSKRRGGGGNKDGDEGVRPAGWALVDYGSTESLYYTPETDVILSFSYMGIKI